jgi:hypothetical protein
VPDHDALNGRETDAGALEFGHGVEALERAEELLGVRHVESGAVVAYEEGARAILLGDSELDARARGLRGELPGVAEQILENCAGQVRVGVALDAVPDGPRSCAKSCRPIRSLSPSCLVKLTIFCMNESLIVPHSPTLTPNHVLAAARRLQRRGDAPSLAAARNPSPPYAPTSPRTRTGDRP